MNDKNSQNFLYKLLFLVNSIIVLCYSMTVSSEVILTDKHTKINKYTHSIDSYDALLTSFNKAEVILIGDSTHGTHEFYKQRIEITKKLIVTKGFRLIAIEANWPETNLLNLFIQSKLGYDEIKRINPFKAYPSWMWRNNEVLSFLFWLRDYNKQRDMSDKVSLFGIDLYSYHRSIQEVTGYLSAVNSIYLDSVNELYTCLSQYKYPSDYGKQLSQDKSLSCEKQAMSVYNLFLDCKIQCINFITPLQRDKFFHAQQHAFIVANNEQYYRSMYTQKIGSESWNIRDKYMFETLLTIRRYLDSVKTVVWAHNSHLGDARATAAVEVEQLNIGQLLRVHLKEKLFSIGMFSYFGNVIASDEWGGKTRSKYLRPAHKNSVEFLFSQLNRDNFYLVFNQLPNRISNWLNNKIMERHVGVVYIPENELENHYGGTQIVDEFDAILFIEKTTALDWFENF